MTLPHAIIIAGGKGERLGGVRKADLRIGGVPLLERVRSALGPVLAPVMIATGPGEPSMRQDDYISVADLNTDLGGPLAGLASAVAALQAQGIGNGFLVSVAVDTPFLPDDFISLLQGGIGDAAAAYAKWGDAFYPPNALLRLEALQDLPAQVMSGTAPSSLKALLGSLDAQAVDWRERSSTDPFRNLNTLDDLLALGRIAKSR